MFERAINQLVLSITQAGPYVAGIILIYVLMIWISSRRRTVDLVVLRTGQIVIVLLAIAMIADVVGIDLGVR